MNLQETATQAAPKHLGFAEQKALEEQIRQLQDAHDEVEVEGAQGVKHETRDRKGLSQRLAHLKKIHDAQKVVEATGAERENLEKEEKILRERLDPKMSWDEYSMTQRKHGMRYQRLVAQIQKWNSDPKYQADMKKWKYIRRRLDPNDPNISNVMHLFREK